jgi:hypothetical protein
MDDNILSEGNTKLCSPTEYKKADGDQEQMKAIHIIDFSDLSIGELLIYLIP